MKYLWKAFPLALVILLVAAVSAMAFGEIRYADRSMNLRDSRSLSGEVAGTLQAGQKVRVGFVQNGWAAVFEPSETRETEDAAVGYLKLKYLNKEPGAAIFKAWSRKVEAQQPLDIFTEPSRSASKVTTLPKGEVVLLAFGKAGWTMVFPQGATIRSKMGAIGYAENKGFKKAAGNKIGPVIRTVPAKSVPVADLTTENVLAAGTKPGATVAPAHSGQAAKSGKSGKSGTRQVVSIDKAMFGGKRPDPPTNKIAHGYKYSILRNQEITKGIEKWVTLKVFVGITKLPKLVDLNDFAATLWKEHRKQGQPFAILLYVPGMNTEDLSYGVFKFSDTEFLESWVRRTTLFGTKFDKQKKK